MAVSILNLKQQKIRKTFNIGEDVVEVYNITKENRHIFDKVFEENLDYENGEIEISDKALIVTVYTTLTNIEFQNPDEVMEALENPSIELEMINNELRAVITEFANSKIQDQLAKLQELEMLLSQVELTNQATDLANKVGIDKKAMEKEATTKLRSMRSSNKKAGEKNEK